MQGWSASLLSFGVMLPLTVASLPAAAGENDEFLKIIGEFCIGQRGTVAQVTARAMKLPYRPQAMNPDKGPPYADGVVLASLGGNAILTFGGARASAPASICRIVAYAHDLTDLVARLRENFDLPEPRASEVDVQLRTAGKKTIDGKTLSVQLVYGFEEKKTSGAFTLTVTR